MADALGKKGKVGYIFHDADFYVTNQRDQAFKKTIEQDYPDMKIVAEQGMADPARAEEIAQAHGDPASRSRRHLCHLGRAGALRARGAARRRQHAYQDRDARPQRAGWRSTWSRAAMSRRSSPTRPTISASRLPAPRAGSLIGKKAAPFLVVDSLAVTKDTVEGRLEAVAQQGRAASIAEP